MNAELFWKVFAVALGGSVLYSTVAAAESFSAVGAVVLLFKALTVVGLVGFAWRRAIFRRQLWKAVLIVQLLAAVVFLLQVVGGFVRFSDAALFVPLLQGTLIYLFFTVFTLIGLFLYAWSPVLWVREASAPAEPTP